jgi:hypothetical protein
MKMAHRGKKARLRFRGSPAVMAESPAPRKSMTRKGGGARRRLRLRSKGY